MLCGSFGGGDEEGNGGLGKEEAAFCRGLPELFVD